jgi:hypothetical protein
LSLDVDQYASTTDPLSENRLLRMLILPVPPSLWFETIDCCSGRQWILIPLRVERRVGLHLFGHHVFRVDRLDRTGRLTGAAVDTFVWVDEKHPIFPFGKVDAVYWANVDARLIHDVDARFRNYVRQLILPCAAIRGCKVRVVFIAPYIFTSVRCCRQISGKCRVERPMYDENKLTDKRLVWA